MIGIDSLSSACPMGPSRMRLRPSPSVMVCRSRLRSAVGQQHELATSAAGKADVERLAPVFEDEGLRDGDREAPPGSKSAELAELVPTQVETAFSLDVLRAGARARSEAEKSEPQSRTRTP